jgi:hypothetical protein
MSLYYRTLIQGGLLLDTYPNAAVAYSLRKLREGYKKVFNLLTYSEDISQAVYSKSALNVTGTPPYVNVVTAPNGTLTADKVIEDSVTNTHFLSQFHSPTVVGLDYNFSVYLKAGERTKVSFQSPIGTATINLLTGVIETFIGVAPNVTDEGSGWWRVSITFTAASTIINPLYRIFLVNGSNLTGYLGDGTSGVYVWGFQLTLGSSLLPYEKTIVGPSNGSAIRVRRGDLTEQDFGFNSSGVLDTDAIVNFFGNNLLFQSENFEIITGGWGRTSTNVIAGSIVGPNGTDLSCKFNETSTSGFHTLTQGAQFPLTIGKDYIFSVYFKAGERDVIEFVSGIAGSSQVVRFNITTGSVISNTFTNSPTLTNVGDDWWKFEIIVKSTVASVPTGFQMRLTNGTLSSYVGTVGWGCYIWGAQVSGYTGTPVPYFRTTTTTAANAFVSRYYDQSENGNNLVNSSSGDQYRIIANGHLYLNSDNGLPSTLVTTRGFYTFTGVNISTSNPLVNFNVYKSAPSPANMILFGNSVVSGRPVMNHHFGAAGSRVISTRLTNASGQDFSLPFETNGSFITSTTRDTSNYQEVSVNNSVLGGNSMGTSAAANITHLGRYNSSANSSAGEIQEMIIWKQNYISLKSNISDKINEYYGIY